MKCVKSNTKDAQCPSTLSIYRNTVQFRSKSIHKKAVSKINFSFALNSCS